MYTVTRPVDSMLDATGAPAPRSAAVRSPTGLLRLAVARTFQPPSPVLPAVLAVKLALMMLNTVSEKMISANMAMVMPVRKRLDSGYATPIFSAGAKRG